jgi:tripartite ATP-independent transporter DctM subunit
MTAITIMIVLFFIFLILGVPVAFNMGISSLIYFVLTRQALSTIPEMMFEGVNSFVFLAIPLFMLAGNVMNETGITNRIINVANTFVGHMRGGLAQVNVVGSMLFAGCSGSALADISGLGSIEIAMMEKSGYKKDFSCAITAASAIQGPLIPPSIPMVVFGAAANVSIGALFLGGAVPGALIGLSDMVVNYFIAKKRNFSVKSQKASLKEMVRHLGAASFAILMPVIIMGGILTGIFTPTEAAAVGVAYAILVSFIYKHKISGKAFYKICKDVVKMGATIYLLIATSSVFGWVLANEQVPKMIVETISKITTNPYGLILIINIMLLIWGLFMDSTPAIILLGPILLPLMSSIGIHPVHFGVIMVTNLVIGLITPPYGVGLFVTSVVGKIKLEILTKAILPYLMINFCVLALISYFPQVVLFLPKLFGLI